jgi:NAD(P)-dependent dehydrogenase (short-subunit alcohol dehydrogenase family)
MAVALVTGAGNPRGLGAAVAAALAAQGHTVWLTARTEAQAAARAAEIGPKAIAAALDVTDRASAEALANRIAATGLDILVSNAAAPGAWGETATGADLTAVRQVIETNLLAPWMLVQVFLPLLSASKAPRIVNVSSGAGSHADPVFGLHTANAMAPSYAVSKAALTAFTVRLARELPQMRVNAVCPGFTASFEGGEGMGARPAADSAPGVVWAATLPEDGPTGGLFRDGQPLGW